MTIACACLDTFASRFVPHSDFRFSVHDPIPRKEHFIWKTNSKMCTTRLTGARF
jgi:mannosyltransferase OCH1-like enzyme